MKFFSKWFARPAPTDSKVVWNTLLPRVAGLSRPAIRLTKTTEPTRSWIGGQPVADPKTFAWPVSAGKPMAFLAQLDLSELSAAHRFSWLPDTGVLAFFYDLKAMPWGFDPKDEGKWKVLHLDAAIAEIPYPPSLGDGSRLAHSFVCASQADIFPDADCPAIEALDLSDEESDAYCDFRESKPEDLPSHQVGGFPSPVQGNIMDLECQLASNGVYVGKSEGYESARAKELEHGAKDWRLLLQLDSDDDLEFMWGDAGMIYFWIREEDAEANRFDRTWLILQCG